MATRTIKKDGNIKVVYGGEGLDVGYKKHTIKKRIKKRIKSVALGAQAVYSKHIPDVVKAGGRAAEKARKRYEKQAARQKPKVTKKRRKKRKVTRVKKKIKYQKHRSILKLI